MIEENINRVFRLKIIDKTRHYFVEEIQQNKLMIKKHKKGCTTLNCITQLYYFLILVSMVTEHISISSFASLVDIPLGIRISARGLKICTVTA